MPILCASRVSQVTVHARGAWVVRTVELPPDLPDQDLELVVPEVTPLADAGSLRASVTGTQRRVVSVQTALAIPGSPALPGATAARVRELGRKLDRLQSERDRLGGHRVALIEVEPAPRLRPATSDSDGSDGVAARIADGLATAGLVADVLAAVDGRLAELDEAIRFHAEELEAARVNDAQASSRARMGTGHPTRRVHIRLGGVGPVASAEIAYVVPAARWWPTYTVRFVEGARRAQWTMEALVAQLSGEDWSGVALALSTADLVADARLPELPARRLGRVQPPPRRGYRAPPEGLERLFAGWDRAFAGVAAPPPSLARDELDELASSPPIDPFVSDAEEEVTRPGAAERTGKHVAYKEEARMPPPVMVPAQALRPPPGSAPRMAARALVAAGPLIPPTTDSPAPPETLPPGEVTEPDDSWLDFDVLALASAEDATHRGRLVKAGAGAIAARARQAATVLEARDPGSPVVDVLASRGRFDHRYDAAGASDVPADGAAHRVTVAVAEATTSLRYRSVPREAPSVYKEAELENPFAAPLLAGPVDIYVEGSLILTTAIQHIDRGGKLSLGLGVEERIRVARNVRAEETTAGILGNSAVVGNEVTIDLASALAVKVRVEVLERVPTSDDRSLEIVVTGASPAPEDYDQSERGAPIRGGRRFVVDLGPGDKARVRYTVRFVFPGKSEIAGGNRRD